MTFEERMDGLAKSFEAQKERQDALTRSVKMINYRTMEHTKQLEIDSANIRKFSWQLIGTKEMIERLAVAAETLLAGVQSRSTPVPPAPSPA